MDAGIWRTRGYGSYLKPWNNAGLLTLQLLGLGNYHRSTRKGLR